MDITLNPPGISSRSSMAERGCLVPGGEGEGCSPALKPVEFAWPELRPVWCQWLFFHFSVCDPVRVHLLSCACPTTAFWGQTSLLVSQVPKEGGFAPGGVTPRASPALIQITQRMRFGTLKTVRVRSDLGF